MTFYAHWRKQNKFTTHGHVTIYILLQQTLPVMLYECHCFALLPLSWPHLLKQRGNYSETYEWPFFWN